MPSAGARSVRVMNHRVMNHKLIVTSREFYVTGHRCRVPHCGIPALAASAALRLSEEACAACRTSIPGSSLTDKQKRKKHLEQKKTGEKRRISAKNREFAEICGNFAEFQEKSKKC